MALNPSTFIDPRKGLDPKGDALRLLQVLEQRGRQAAEAARVSQERAALISFAEYAENFRQVQEFLSFCEVLEGRLDVLDIATREIVQKEVTGVKLRCYSALLKAMAAYLGWMEKRGMLNYFAQAVFLTQQEALEYFRVNQLPALPPSMVPDYLPSLQAEIEGALKRLIERSVDIPDFRFER